MIWLSLETSSQTYPEVGLNNPLGIPIPPKNKPPNFIIKTTLQINKNIKQQN